MKTSPMTIEDLEKLSGEEKRKRIAELCGWTFVNDILVGTTPDGEEDRVAPDYLNDLNAMHEACSRLTERQSEVFAYLLEQIAVPCTEFDEIHIPEADSRIGYIECDAAVAFKLINATAAQRADAFLLTADE